jgi:hypothetical protein
MIRVEYEVSPEFLEKTSLQSLPDHGEDDALDKEIQAVRKFFLWMISLKVCENADRIFVHSAQLS